MANTPPVLTVSTSNIDPTAPILLSSIVTFSDPDGDTPTEFVFDDISSDGTSAVFLDGQPLKVGSDTADDNHLTPGQFARATIQPGTGYRVLFPYNEEYCGQADKSVCTGRSPLFLDIGLSFGVTAGLEVLGEVQFGLESDFKGLSGAAGPTPLSFAAFQSGSTKATNISPATKSRCCRSKDIRRW